MALRDRVEVLLEADLLGGVRQLQRGQPAQVRSRPGAFSRVGDAVAQQQGLEAVAGVALFAHGVLAGTHQVAHGLVGCARHTHRSQVSRSRQPRQHHRVAPVGLDSVARALGNRRGRHHLAFDTRRTQVPPNNETARAGFVHHMQPMSPADQFSQRLVQRRKIPADAAHMSNLTVAPGVRRGDVDAVLVNVQTDVQNARFLHGPSPSKFATT